MLMLILADCTPTLIAVLSLSYTGVGGLIVRLPLCLSSRPFRRIVVCASSIRIANYRLYTPEMEPSNNSGSWFSRAKQMFGKLIGSEPSKAVEQSQQKS